MREGKPDPSYIQEGYEKKGGQNESRPTTARPEPPRGVGPRSPEQSAEKPKSGE